MRLALLCVILGVSAMLTMGVTPAFGTDVPQYGTFERSFTHTGSYENPHAQSSASATFRDPAGKAHTIGLFWDGGATWRVRFSSDAQGVWSYKTASKDPGLDGQGLTLPVDSATYFIRRFDPRTGQSAAQAAYSGSGPLALVSPDTQDWVFVVTTRDVVPATAPRKEQGPAQN